MIVIIDAGHGIETAGKRAPDGSYLEYEFNRDVAGRIQRHLARCGIDARLTCPDEHDLSLSERCRISNAAGADYFVSIHTDAFGDGNSWTEPSGWSAHVIAKGGNAQRLAEAIRAEAIPMLGCRDRGVRVSNYQVLRDTKAPAVLIEHGFHTNREEVELLKSDAYRGKCALSDAKGICAQAGVEWAEQAQGRAVTIDALRRMGYDRIVF